jgi:hypothetical protein
MPNNKSLTKFFEEIDMPAKHCPLLSVTVAAMALCCARASAQRTPQLTNDLPNPYQCARRAQPDAYDTALLEAIRAMERPDWPLSRVGDALGASSINA